MKFLYFPVLTLFGVVAAEISHRGLLNDGDDFVSRNFDYVIIGGGTAGLALAARLSEDSDTSVGVIEAGEYLPDDPLINTPAICYLQLLLFRYQETPHMTGNSSPFLRASKVEYDAWDKLGNPGWDWDGLLPNMEAAERFTGVDSFRVNYANSSQTDIFPSQGKNGPVAASYNNWYSDIALPYGKSMVNLGVPVNFDPDSGNAFGMFNSATSVNRATGRRSYAANTYYAYNAHRPNLVVLTGAQATKINFQNASNSKTEDLVATGVSFVHKSQTYIVRANKEVILSAGTFQSPHLLELSGIGNSTILEKNGIKTLIDLPTIGENYQDHLLVPIAYELKPGSSILNYDVLRNNATFAASAAAQYNATHDGILSSTLSIISFINLDHLASTSEINNMTAQLNREIASERLTPLQNASYDIQKGWLKEKVGLVEIIPYPGYAGIGTPKANTSYLTFFAAVEHPFSRGNVHLNSSNPLVPPQIDPNYLSKSIGEPSYIWHFLVPAYSDFSTLFELQDLEILVRSVKFVQRLSETEPLASIIALRQEPAPEIASDVAIIDYIKAYFDSAYHPIGTASLAPKVDGGVVDAHLKVYGTANVRVVDASVIPLHIGTHLQRTVYGIAEKAAQIIKEGH
ncbi:hypothetical protein RSOLAG22IIIB_08434 [Rhizoctonia solani]|uniref:Glucose-methanol-choline oxidoreductase N-terminal domain-containing protein n=1 Tax=Rhizoctonia solani TaxID=456999 RepID=A0A0K6FST6_9AGAM|nr:hypothetical protein RSOLAG22IIIB_08434 [Rhizoctonia solani]